MAVKRQVISKITRKIPLVEVSSEEAEPIRAKTSEGNQEVGELAPKQKKKCPFCEGKVEPNYTDSASLRRFLSDRGRIHPRSRIGSCAKHQRRLTRQIKRARHLALLPFVVKI